ncbi:MAG: fumarylacetoacetase [Saprospiraceae bacterium]
MTQTPFSDSEFSINNIPFGIGVIEDKQQVCTRFGDHIIPLSSFTSKNVFDLNTIPGNVLFSPFLNEFIALGKKITVPLRLKIQSYLREIGHQSLKTYPASSVTMTLPIKIGDYTDFYSSREHATNVGTMFRDPANALLPNWLHLPVGYHGRSSSIVVSGTPVRRPNGQTIPLNAEQPIFGPCKQLDFELEMAFVVGKGNELGQCITTNEAESHIFGLALFNDWSARDIQKWEYVPLGPFLAKNFASTLSPWIVTLEALNPFRIEGPAQDPEVLPYLQYEGNHHYDIQLEVSIQPHGGKGSTICHSNFKYMYWNILQQLTHHTVNGCNMNVGDLLASGTISGPTPDSYGSMLELAWKGTKPITLSDGTQRTFIQDGDTVMMKGFAEKDGIKIGFGECVSTILPAQ